MCKSKVRKYLLTMVQFTSTDPMSRKLFTLPALSGRNARTSTCSPRETRPYPPHSQSCRELLSVPRMSLSHTVCLTWSSSPTALSFRSRTQHGVDSRDSRRRLATAFMSPLTVTTPTQPSRPQVLWELHTPSEAWHMRLLICLATWFRSTSHLWLSDSSRSCWAVSPAWPASCLSQSMLEPVPSKLPR